MTEITTIPEMTTTERDALSGVATGTLILNSTTQLIETYNGVTWDSNNLDYLGLISPATVVTTTPYDVLPADYIVGTNLPTSTAPTVNLPVGVDGRRIVVEDFKGDAGSNNISIVAHAGDTFEDGTTTYVLPYGGGCFEFYCDSSIWYVILFD